MELSVLERLLLLNILPGEGDITTLKIVRQLREGLSFTEEEHKAFALKSDGGQITWDDAVAKGKELEIGKKAAGVIVQALKKRSAEGKLDIQYIDLYDRFVESEDKD